MKNYKIVNWFKRNIYGVVFEYGCVNRIGFKSNQEWYIDMVLYKFGKPVSKKRYWNIKDLNNNKSFENTRSIVKGFQKK